MLFKMVHFVVSVSDILLEKQNSMKNYGKLALLVIAIN